MGNGPNGGGTEGTSGGDISAGGVNAAGGGGLEYKHGYPHSGPQTHTGLASVTSFDTIVASGLSDLNPSA